MEGIIHPSLLYTGFYNVNNYITGTYKPDNNLVKPSYNKVKKKRGRDIFIPSTDPIVFDEIRTKYDLEEINSRILSSNMDEDILDTLSIDDKFKFEIKRTIHALKFWELTPGQKGLAKEDIFRDTLLMGPAYAEKLSDKWEFGIRRKMTFAIFGRDYSNWERVTNYNYYPPVQYLIRWAEKVQDIDYMTIPLNPFNKGYMEEFSEHLYNLLPDDINIPNDIEVLSLTKTSTSYSFEHGKTIPMYKARQSPDGKRFSQIFKAARSIIPVGPANTRDAVVTTIDTFNSMKWCDLVTLEVLNKFNTSLVNSSSSTFLRRLKKMTRMPQGKCLFYHRDIKKAGLTFPRELFHLVQETLSRKYPDKDFSRFNIYRNYSIYKDNKPFETVRGYCLGMANNLITLCQCIIYEMIQERVGSNLNLNGLFGNDDSIIRMGVNNWEDVESNCQILEVWDRQICEGLNIMLHNDKTFWSLSPVIYEEYGDPDLSRKGSRLACALSGAFLAPNIKYAKCMVNALSPLFTGEDWEYTLLNKIISYWGSEYYPSESLYDYQLGGWTSHRSYHCSTVLREIEEMQPSEYDGAFLAMQSIKAFQKALLRPGTSSSITENYSVLGSTYGIMWILNPDALSKHLPYESLFLSKEDYNSFYETLYEFSRRPIKFLAFVDKRTPKIRIPAKSTFLMDLRVMAHSLRGPKAIPDYMIYSTTSLWNKNEIDTIDLPFLWYRNGISRYLQLLKEQKIIRSEADIHGYAGDEFIYTSEYDTSPFQGNSEIDKYELLDGSIPKGIYQFSSNPWLPINEYAKVYDVIPKELNVLWEDKIHPDDRFTKTDPQDERELAFTRILLPRLGLEQTNEVLEMIREYKAGEQPEPDIEENEIEFCDEHIGKQLNAGWHADRMTFHPIEYCVLCQYIFTWWKTKIVSTTNEDLEIREQKVLEVAAIKNSISKLCSMLRYSIEEIEEMLYGPPDLFDLDESGSDSGGGFFDFGDD
jgi:hypothetical protein